MLKLSDAKQARVVEVFSSIQGEGLRLGERQIFVRFGGCNLHCDYCDEPDTIPIPSGDVWPRKRLEEEIARLASERPHKSISWTGGEPLLHAAFLKPMLEWAHGKGLQNYFETNGTLPEALRELAPLCDVVSMDVKLPSSTGRTCWSAHLECLRVAPEKTFVKVVLTAGSKDDEWRQVIRLLQEIDPRIPLVLQPATAIGDVKPIEPERALALLRQARGLIKDVRLIPQWHPVWGLP
ncbi:MAG: 7-carboxy-7-deazaguanine synthase QueE [Elusimicrobia bacterium]|nr:7-carboxy-7-deazaguanine synthase QueE [Elusimicrobiota bacterium]